MVNLGELILAAFVGAVVSETVNLLFEYVRYKFKGGGKRRPPKTKGIPTFIIRWIIGAAIGVAVWLFFLYPKFITPFWTFDNGPDNWVYTYNTLDASNGVDWDDDKEVLIAQFDFSQVAGSVGAGNRDPRATYSIDNLLPDWRHDWSGYEILKVDVRNTTSYPLEMTFSIFIDGCFYEFGGWNNLPSKSAPTTVVFNFTEPQYKTCISPDTFSNPPGTLDRIQRLDIIIGENVAPGYLSDVKGAVFIDNVRLQKNLWPLWTILGIFSFVFAVGVFLTWRQQQKSKTEEDQKKKPETKEDGKQKSQAKEEQ